MIFKKIHKWWRKQIRKEKNKMILLFAGIGMITATINLKGIDKAIFLFGIILITIVLYRKIKELEKLLKNEKIAK